MSYFYNYESQNYFYVTLSDAAAIAAGVFPEDVTITIINKKIVFQWHNNSELKYDNDTKEILKRYFETICNAAIKGDIEICYEEKDYDYIRYLPELVEDEIQSDEGIELEDVSNRYKDTLYDEKLLCYILQQNEIGRCLSLDYIIDGVKGVATTKDLHFQLPEQAKKEPEPVTPAPPAELNINVSIINDAPSTTTPEAVAVADDSKEQQTQKPEERALKAVKEAFQAGTDKEFSKKTSPKKQMIEWLENRYKEYDLTYNGQRNNTMIERIAKLANPNPKGGAPKTL